MTAAIVVHSVLQLLAELIAVTALGFVGFVLACAAHDMYVRWRNPHGIPRAQPPRREPPRRLDRWGAVPLLGVFLTHGHVNGLVVAVPVLLFVAVLVLLAVQDSREQERRRQARRAAWLERIRASRADSDVAGERYSEIGYPR